MRIVWVYLLLMSGVAHGANSVEVRFPLSVYAKPDFESPVSFTVEAGAVITVSDRAYGGFKKIKANVFGKFQTGYVAANDLISQKKPPKKRKWGAGAGFAYTRLAQGAKSFSTNDEVNYKITSYTGQTTNPALSLQWGQRNFWRAHGIYRKVVLDGSATNDLNTPAQEVHLEYTMLALQLQAGWGIWSDVWYAGVGIEGAKSVAGSVRLGNQDLTSDTENPNYMSAHGFSGVQVRFQEKFSVLAELKLGAVANQTPVVTVMEIAASVLYWP